MDFSRALEMTDQSKILNHVQDDKLKDDGLKDWIPD
jgi:hypothetical protein